MAHTLFAYQFIRDAASSHFVMKIENNVDPSPAFLIDFDDFHSCI